MKFKNTFYSMHHTVLLSYHLVHSYLVLVKTILLFYLIKVQSFIILLS